MGTKHSEQPGARGEVNVELANLRSVNVTPEEMRASLETLYVHAREVFPEDFRPQRAVACPYCYKRDALNMFIVGKTGMRGTVLHVDPPCVEFKEMDSDEFVDGADKELAAMKAN